MQSSRQSLFPGSPETRSSPAAQDGVSLYALADAGLRHIRPLLVIPIVAVIAAVALALLLPRTYTARATILPNVGNAAAGNLSGLAERFGLNMGGLPRSESLDLYAELLTSSDILLRAAATEYQIPGKAGGTAKGNLIALYEIEADNPVDRRRRLLRRMRSDIAATPNIKTGIVTLETSAPSPALAEALNERLLELLREFNQLRWQSRARAERTFLEAQLAEANQALRRSEAELTAFLTQNRVTVSPSLMLEQARLQRQVDLNQQVFLTIRQSFERARLDEVHETPVFTIVDTPRGSAVRTGPPRPELVMVGALLGVAIALGLVFMREYAARQRALHPEEYQHFRDRRKRIRWLPSREASAS